MIRLIRMCRRFNYANRFMENYKMIANLAHGELVVGLNKVIKSIEEGTTRCVVVASDSDSFIVEKVTSLAMEYGVEFIECPTRVELGRLCRVDVATAVCAIKKRDK